MADENRDPDSNPRPASRRGKARPRDDNAAEGMAGPSREQQVKEKKKPRKLEMRSVVLQEPTVTLDMRVDRLERQFAGLSSRVDTVEVRQVRRPAANTYRRSSSASTRATPAARARPKAKAPRHSTGDRLTPRPSLAEQLRESQRLRRTHQRRRSGEEDGVEELPRSALLSTSEARQVALTGHYNIPLPAQLSAEDILNIRSGLTAAGSIVRNLTNAWKAPSSSQETGTSGTRPTTESGTEVRSVVHGRSDRKEHFDRSDDRQEPPLDDDNKENVFDTGKTNSSSDCGAFGNAQPEEHDVLGVENASSSWRNFLLQAGGAVASVAKDAAVEFSSDSAPAGEPDASIRAASASSSTARQRDAGPPASRRPGGYAASTSSSSHRQRIKASRTSSRASTRAA